MVRLREKAPSQTRGHEAEGVGDGGDSGGGGVGGSSGGRGGGEGGGGGGGGGGGKRETQGRWHISFSKRDSLRGAFAEAIATGKQELEKWASGSQLQHAVEFVKGLPQELAEHALLAKDQLVDFGRQQATDAVAKQWDRFVERKRRYYVLDPSMPSFLRPFVESLWRYVEPHVRDEFLAVVEFEIGLRKRRAADVEHSVPWSMLRPGGGRVCRAKWRAGFLYALDPFDKTFWSKIRNPRWILIKAACCIPIFQSFSFALILCLIDRKDDYQLLQWILSFKQFQFWITGLGELVFTAWSYSYCVNVLMPSNVARCGESLESSEADLVASWGSWLLIWLLLASWLLQMILLWVALILLYFSYPKGGSVRYGERLVGETVLWKELVDPSEFTSLRQVGPTSSGVCLRGIGDTSGKDKGEISFRGVARRGSERDGQHESKVESAEDQSVDRAVEDRPGKVIEQDGVLESLRQATFVGEVVRFNRRLDHYLVCLNQVTVEGREIIDFGCDQRIDATEQGNDLAEAHLKDLQNEMAVRVTGLQATDEAKELGDAEEIEENVHEIMGIVGHSASLNTREELRRLRRQKRFRHVALSGTRYFVIQRKAPIRHFLYFDLTCFLLVMLIVILWFIDGSNRGSMKNSWQFRALLTGARIGYSLCAFPFFFISFPPWKYVFTHAKETGYNVYGTCVPRKFYKEFSWVHEAAVSAVNTELGSLKGDVSGKGEPKSDANSESKSAVQASGAELL